MKENGKFVSADGTKFTAASSLTFSDVGSFA